MIYVENTPNNAGVTVYGDYNDFEHLYDALHTVTGDEHEFVSYDSSRIRVLGVCYDLRHAIMGDRGVKLVDNGMNKDIMKYWEIITSEKNVYLKINVLWPEMLFVTMALNDFVWLYANKKLKKGYNMMMDKKILWDEHLAHVRLFQAAIAKCIGETVSDKTYARMLNMMNKDYPWMENYITQYLDILNDRFIQMDREKRLESISLMAKRLSECEKEYKKVRSDVVDAAAEYNCPVDNIRLQLDFPEDIDW